MALQHEVAGNDNGRGDLRILEARFHPHGQGSEFIVIGRVLCWRSYSAVDIAADFEAGLQDRRSARSIVSNLVYLTLMNRPRVFEGLLSLDNRYWSFVLVGEQLGRVSH